MFKHIKSHVEMIGKSPEIVTLKRHKRKVLKYKNVGRARQDYLHEECGHSVLNSERQFRSGGGELRLF